jgi:hypothetical protein
LDEKHVTEIGQARLACPNAVVIGVIPSGTRKPILNPPSDMRIKGGDALIYIAKHFADCAISDVVEPTSRPREAGWHPGASSVETVLVLGWSRRVPQVIAELLSYQQNRLRIDVAGMQPLEERKMSIASVVNAQQAETVRQSEVNFLDPEALAEIHPENYDAVLLIARERMGHEEVADAATLSGYLTIDTLLTGAKGPHVVAEVLEEENEALFDGEHCDAIVSPMVVSYILSQVALEPELGLIIQELTLSFGTTILFRSLELGSAGVRQTRLNPGAESRWACKDIEQVIVLGTVLR